MLLTPPNHLFPSANHSHMSFPISFLKPEFIPLHGLHLFKGRSFLFGPSPQLYLVVIAQAFQLLGSMWKSAVTSNLTKQKLTEITCEYNRNWQFCLHFPVRKLNLEINYKYVQQAQWQIWYFPLDLTLSRNQPCAYKPNKHYSMSQKSMGLSLLCLIGLRRNQIERDNCVPVTFPLRQARAGRRGLREGQWMCVCMCVCANMCGAG